MESSASNLQGMNRDVLRDILGRVDGVGLASVSSTCCDLRDLAQDQSLWEQLCHSTWPSTSLDEAKHLIKPSVIGGFDKFYADSYPLILYDHESADESCSKSDSQKPQTSPSDLVSLVDVYWNNNCVMSKILDSIPDAAESIGHKFAGSNWGMSATEREQWFLNFPFKLEILRAKDDEDEDEDDENNDGYGDHDADNHEISSWQSIPELSENLRLSWILFDKTTGKAVNLSSLKPLLVQRNWLNQGDYVANFGCVLPVEESVLPNKVARFMIKIHFKMTETEGFLWKEVNLGVEDVNGVYVDGRRSLMVLNKAVHSLRSANRSKVEEGFHQYEKLKNEMLKKRQFREHLTDGLYISLEMAFFAISSHYLSLLGTLFR